MTHCLAYFFLSYFLLSICPATADTEVVNLQHRTPEELLPTLSPFLSKDAIIKSFQNQIIIQTNAENLISIKKMLLELDKPAKKLLLSVSQSKEAPNEQFSVDIQGNVIFGQEPFTLSSQVNTITTKRTIRQEHQNLNRIQVLSGQAATIMSGKTIATLTNRGALQSQGDSSLNKISESTTRNQITSGFSQEKTGAIQEQYAYNQLQSGLIVTPTLLGDQVRLAIMLQNEVPVQNQDNHLTSNTVTSAMQKTHTVLQVPLGKWIYIGGNQVENTHHASSGVYHTQNRDESNMSIWLRVDTIGQIE